MQLPTKTLVALLPFFMRANAGASGTGTTTRYWDCCKPSCAWPGKAALVSGSHPVTTCDISDNPLTDYNAASGCGTGSAYQCSNESPWAVSDNLSYGYAAVNIAGGNEASWCCACYELTFTSGAVAGKKMIVQATNTGSDLSGNQFDISMPGGGVGIFNGCTAEWGAPSAGWGAQYGGISSRSACASFPKALQAGCYWRYDWFAGCDNPTVSFKQVACPAAITANSGCTRADDASMPAAGGGDGKPVVAASSSAPAAVPIAAAPSSSKSEAQIVASVASAESVATTSAAPVVVSKPSTTSAAPVVFSSPSPPVANSPIQAANPYSQPANSPSTVVIATTFTVIPMPASTANASNPQSSHAHNHNHFHQHQEPESCDD